MFFIPSLTGSPREAIVHIVASNVAVATLDIASNCQVEVWANNEYVGPGGDRCSSAKVFSRTYSVDGRAIVVVRLHWINKTKVTCRRTVTQPMVWIGGLNPGATVDAGIETGYVVGERACSQLPCQGGYFRQPPGPRVAVPLHQCETHPTGVAVHRAGTRDLRLVPVVPTLVKRHVSRSPGKSFIGALAQPLPCLHTFALAHASDLSYRVLDLGQIAAHRLEIVTGEDSPCIVLYAEVPSLAQMRTSNRAKTKLADYIGPSCRGRVFGKRGCRYLHLFQDGGRGVVEAKVSVACRFEYPFDWKPEKCVRPGPVPAAIAAAVKANLVAVVGSDIVDTCWREDTAWTGDATVALRVLSDLSNNREIARHVTAQIAETYNPDLGMVAAIVPVPAHTALYIPSYHLLFCLLLGQLEPDELAPEAARVIVASIAFWREHYVYDGIINVPSTDKRVWHFIDWTAEASSRGDAAVWLDCNAVVNSLWVQLHTLCGFSDHGIDVGRFNSAFQRGAGYAMTATSPEPHIHATANAMLAGLVPDVAAAGEELERLVTSWEMSKVHPSDFRHGGPTAFYAAFVCDALRLWSDDVAFQYALRFYGPMATKYGTLFEKKVDTASLAHSWSVGVARHVIMTPVDCCVYLCTELRRIFQLAQPWIV